MSKGTKPDGRQNNGRPKGSINKRTKAMVAKANKGGMLPAEFLLKQMRNSKHPMELRMQAAAAAAPYFHARLQAIKHSGAVTLTHEEALRQLAE